LQELCKESQNKKIYLHKANANKVLPTVLSDIQWNKSRAVLFLDPYGLEVEWETLVQISKTKAIDLWFLFSLSGLYRQAARNYAALDKHKERILDACLGTTQWREAFYEHNDVQLDLFGGSSSKTVRTAEWDDLLHFVQERLKTLFAKVPAPLILPATGAPLYALFFAVSNPNVKAIGLSMRAANHILKNPGK
jgi:three-Cys-motif partner protein